MSKKKPVLKLDINAIIVAVLTLIGTIGAAYFMSRGNIKSTELIIHATETAQARALSTVESAPANLLRPDAALKNSEEFETNGEVWIKYYIEIRNWQDFSPDLFKSAPDLPPCGLNNNSSRTWVEIYDGDAGNVLQGYCSLSSSLELQSLWFAVQKNSITPTTVYVLINDRLENKLYISNEVVIR